MEEYFGGPEDGLNGTEEPSFFQKHQSFFRGLLAGVLLSMLLLTVSLLTLRPGLIQWRKESEKGLDGSGLAALATKAGEIIDTIHNCYILEDVETGDLVDGMFKGLMGVLNDKYAAYYTEKEWSQNKQDSSGAYEGIGITMTDRFDIVSVLEDSPAQAAGILPGDHVTAVEGVSTEGMTSDEFSSYVKGALMETRTLTIYRASEERTFDVVVEIGKIVTKTVFASPLEDGLWYVQITKFIDNTPEQFNEIWEQIAADDQFAGLVLDLRGNPGGGLTSVMDIAEVLIPEGLVTYVEEKSGERTEYCSTGEGISQPIAVLCDSSTASAAELLAGALRDRCGSLLVGTTSFGKGIVQTTWSMNDGTAFKMTTAEYFTPNGLNIQGTGLAPDIEVLLTEDEMADPLRDLTGDSQAKAAIEALTKQLTAEDAAA